MTLEFLNTGAPISGFQLFNDEELLSENKTINNWSKSETKKITLNEIYNLSFTEDKKKEYIVRFTNIYGFEKKYVLIFNRKANFLYKHNNISTYDKPIDTASILPIGEQREDE